MKFVLVNTNIKYKIALNKQGSSRQFQPRCSSRQVLSLALATASPRECSELLCLARLALGILQSMVAKIVPYV